MALIYCKECGQQYSDKAIECPNCGRLTSPIKPNKSFLHNLNLILTILVKSIAILIMLLILYIGIYNILGYDEIYYHNIFGIPNN